MLLSDRELRLAIQSGDLLIDPPPPYDSERWQAASIDRLSNFLSGRVEGRSRLARLGIGIHVTAPKIDPGYKNQITLEIFHVGKTKVLIPVHMTICTLLVERLGYPAGQRYQGIFQGPSVEHQSGDT